MEEVTKPMSLTDVIENIDSKKMADNLVTQSEYPVKDAIEKTEVFMNLPAEIKDKIRTDALVNPEIDDIDKAIERNKEKMIAAVNMEREKKGIDEKVTIEDYKDNNVKPITNEVNPISEFEEMFKTKISEDDETDEILESNTLEKKISQMSESEKQMLIFEQMLQEACSPIFIDEETPVADRSNAPYSYKVNRNTEYESVVKSVMEENNVSFKTNKKKSIKSALLRSFVNRHPHVTTPLLNSGFHITLSGASIPEIIQMNTIKTKSSSEYAMKKLAFMSKHIVDTSIGQKMSATQLAQTVFYKDLNTLWFNFILGTLPDEFEYPLTCETKNCETIIKFNIKTDELILNAGEFDDVTKYILYENTNIQDVLSYSKVSKEKVLTLEDSKIKITIVNPTIFDSIYTTSRIEESKVKARDYEDVIGYLMFIKNIAIPDEDGDYIPYNDVKEMLEILCALSENELEIIDDEIQSFSIHNMVKYGVRGYKCPKCGKVYGDTEIDLSQMLFSVSQMRATYSKLAAIRTKKNLPPLSEIIGNE